MKSLLDKIELVPVDALQTYPNNPRQGDVEAIAESLEANGQFQALVVQRSTAFILAGNHTYEAACVLGWETIHVVYVDVDDLAAKKILLAANRTAELGTYDEMALVVLLSELREENEDLLLGTGYTTDNVDELLADALTFYPEFDGEDAEGVAFAASVLDRIMPFNPPSLEAEVETDSDATLDLVGQHDKKPVAKRPDYAPPTEFVIFRFGELRAKVSRASYETFAKTWIKNHDGDLPAAGMAAAVLLGVPEEEVEPALAEGTERWL